MNLAGFDANKVDPNAGYEPLPAGYYTACISESEQKPTKSGSGSYLNLKIEVLEGQYKGRILWSRLNLDNPNPTAVKIAQGELSAICRAVGIPTPNDSSELHFKPVVIRVKLKPNKMTNELENLVDAWHPEGYKPANVATTPAKPIPHTLAAAPSVASWMKK
jgi:hypothetical protein